MTDPVVRPLGPLEQVIMELLWHEAPSSVHDLMPALAARALAYTTVMTTLDRLHKKGLLARTKRGHAYAYAPTLDREGYERRLVSAMLGGLPAASREALVAGFLDFAEADAPTLAALDRLIAERKRGGA